MQKSTCIWVPPQAEVPSVQGQGMGTVKASMEKAHMILHTQTAFVPKGPQVKGSHQGPQASVIKQTLSLSSEEE